MSHAITLNLGSATLKFASFSIAEERIDLQTRDSIAVAHGRAAAALLDEVVAHSGALSPPALIAHRIVHGGERADAEFLDASAVESLRALAPFASLHQGPALELVASAMERWPTARHVGVFDTTWHRGLPPRASTLPLSVKLRSLGLRRFGFHGIAFQSAFAKLCESQPSARDERVVLAHLGGGSSLCAMDRGRSVDTTMGLTPLDGVPMATRSGALDPGVVVYMQRELAMSAGEIERELSRHSGLAGIAERDGDVQAILASDTEPARLAIEVYALRVAQAVAAMATALGGIDHLVFSGGIGAHSSAVRGAIVEHLGWLGATIDAGANAANRERLDADDSRVRIWALNVDEEREMIRSAAALLGLPRAAQAQRVGDDGH